MNKSDITVHALAKINLFLDIERRRSDGFHDIISLMQSVSLSDKITLEKRKSGITVTNTADINLTDDLSFRAAQLFFRESGIYGGVHIHVCKSIPMSAGLAGGSSDAAAVLRGLNILFDAGISDEVLAKYGLSLGSDIPFCIYGGQMIALGRGER